MFINLKATTLALSLLALSANLSAFEATECRRDHHHSHRHAESGVIAAQAIYQGETLFTPTTADQPIPFLIRGFRTNVNVNRDRNVFEIRVPGLYSIDAYLNVVNPSGGLSASAYIAINGRTLLPFFETQTSPIGETSVPLHFTDRLVYLEEGDTVSIVLADFFPGTVVGLRGFTLVALNNSRSE